MSAMLDNEVADLRHANTELQRRLDERTAELCEAQAQKTAMAEVLEIINSSPGNLAPVFEAILENATNLCDAPCAILWAFDGECFRPAASHGVPAAFGEFLRDYPGGSRSLEAIQSGEAFVHNIDFAEINAHSTNPLSRAIVDLGRARTGLLVPLSKNGALLGAIRLFRQEVRPFSDKQIALLQNFAAQAVIAMESARFLTETREALEQQTATAEVLQVINSSPGDLAPVFDAMLEKAVRLCDAVFGTLHTFDGDIAHVVAERNLPKALSDWPRAGRFRPDPERSFMGRSLHQRRTVHVADDAAEEPYRTGVPSAVAAVELGGVRTLLHVPLIKRNTALGVFTIFRQEVRPFSDKQIALLENFAAQAVIAMENARLLTETREALDQQTATAEVLQVINSSPGDLAPVFDAMLEKATRLCEAPFGILRTWDGERFHFGAVHGDPQFCDWVRQRGPIRPDRDASLLGRIQAGERVVCVADAQDDEGYRASSGFREMAEASGIRSAVTVALHKDDALLGIITVYRQEVRPFTDKQIALLQNFAAQAVIAMENARLITETREALEQQTATAEVLQVINSSPGNLPPVFDAMLEKAMRLCDVAFGFLTIYDGKTFRPAALRGVPPELAEYFASGMDQPRPGEAHARLLAGEDLIHSIDQMDEEPYRQGSPLRRAVVDLGGARTALIVALRKDGALLGVFTVYRKEVRPFTDKQIALLQNFAAQAVIAMENARLITETREALEQQTATAEVLRVISGSTTDVHPVFEAIVVRAAKLCEAEFSAVARFDNGLLRLVALSNLLPNEARAFHSLFPRPPTRGFILGRAFLEGRAMHVGDVLADADYDPRTRDVLQSLTGYRTFLGVPILQDGQAIGVIGCGRREVRPFTGSQIDLVTTFADQAVIAIENARLFDNLRDRTDELAQRQAELRVTFDNMADGVAMFDEDLRLTAWNRNFQDLLDLPDALLSERPSYADYVRILADRGEFGTHDIEAELTRRLEDTDQELRFERTRPDGRVIEVRRNAVPGGGFVLIYSDITERKRSEAEIHAARDAAEAAYRDLKAAQASLIQAEKMASLGQLTAGIAYEIKNPLNFVNNFAGLSVELLDELKETVAPTITALDDEKRAEIDEVVGMLTGNLEKIAEHGRRADNIVKSMLEHSRGSSGERRNVDLNGLIEEALNLAYHGGRAQDQNFNVTLERDYAAAIAPIELVPQDITRVCLNLIGNGFYAATKRQKEGGAPKFKPILMVATRNLGDVVEIRVRDNGIGIPPEIRDKLFQPFFTTKPTGEGTGLGLSISYDIITQQHGGTITVDSRVGEFTEFTVRLPRAYRARLAEAAS